MTFEGPLKPKLQDDSKTISQEPSSSFKCSIGTHTSVLSDLPRDFLVLQFTFCFSPSLLIQQLHLSREFCQSMSCSFPGWRWHCRCQCLLLMRCFPPTELKWTWENYPISSNAMAVFPSLETEQLC